MEVSRRTLLLAGIALIAACDGIRLLGLGLSKLGATDDARPAAAPLELALPL